MASLDEFVSHIKFCVTIKVILDDSFLTPFSMLLRQ
jgi:hypothetical protein